MARTLQFRLFSGLILILSSSCTPKPTGDPLPDFRPTQQQIAFGDGGMTYDMQTSGDTQDTGDGSQPDAADQGLRPDYGHNESDGPLVDTRGGATDQGPPDSGADDSNSPPPNQCLKHEDCGSGQGCCFFAESPNVCSPACVPPPDQCTNDSQCTGGMRCCAAPQGNKVCSPGCGATGGACDSPIECTPEQECCPIASNLSLCMSDCLPMAPGSCIDDGDCLVGDCCDTPLGGPKVCLPFCVDPSTMVDCDNDAQCPGPSKCCDVFGEDICLPQCPGNPLNCSGDSDCAGIGKCCSIPFVGGTACVPFPFCPPGF